MCGVGEDGGGCDVGGEFWGHDMPMIVVMMGVMLAVVMMTFL